MPGALDGDGKGALALRGKSGLAARLDLAALRQEPAQAGDILVVNFINAIGGEDIHATATTATATEPATAATEPASATAATTEPGAAATATTAATKPTTATVTTELATATAAVTTTVIGARGTVVATRRAIVRCPLRALLISHGLIPPKVRTSCA